MVARTNAGAAAAWVDTVEAFGNGKLSVAEVLEPAIRLATEGYKHNLFLSSPACHCITDFLDYRT
jgi:gamma-glutamyltranspeptidase